ncbi:MAG: carboxysome shell carbonic anhydrase [Gammaproteobacteria bacterium]|nr:carboxysome shell carbonic anhydrase [Gammaproteobacteria bacterium]
MMLSTSYRKSSMFSRSKAKPPALGMRPIKRTFKAGGSLDVAMKMESFSSFNSNPLVRVEQNNTFHDYEVRIKAGFDGVESVVQQLVVKQKCLDFLKTAYLLIQEKLNLSLSNEQLNILSKDQFDSNDFYAECIFAQFMRMSEDFFKNDPLCGQNKIEAENVFKKLGFHAVGIAACSDGRLAHFSTYVLRLPYSLPRRKFHAGTLFDVSESVRNWVFIEHGRFREGIPNSAEEATKYLKIAVYHFSKSDPEHQGCAAHGSDDSKAATSALSKLNDFKQAIENRFGCGSTIKTLLIGINTDDDSLKIHVPNAHGKMCLQRFVETDALFLQTIGLNAEQAKLSIKKSVGVCGGKKVANSSDSMNALICWLIENNFSQIEYVKSYENGFYHDTGHAERFIGIGSGFEEVQLRNLSYYSFLNTVEEGLNDVNIGIKIFTGLNLSKGLPIPIIIRSDYDGKVPGSKNRAQEKVFRIEQALHERYQELSMQGKLKSMCTLKDNTGHKPAERVSNLVEQ